MKQEIFDKAFANIQWEEAIALLTGEQPLSEDQKFALQQASNNSPETFLPEPVGFIGFQVRAVCGDERFGPLVIVPGNQLIRRRINSIRRNDLAATLNVPQETANIIFTEVQGWEPALNFVISLFNVFKNNPKVSDTELRYKHKVLFTRKGEKRAIRALRFYFNKHQPA